MSGAAPPARPVFETLGERVLLVRFGETVDAALNARVHAACAALAAAAIPGVEEPVPAYASLALRYDPDRWPRIDALIDAVERVLASAAPSPPTPRRHEIPVCYGGAHGIDLDAVAAQTGLTPDEVVACHVAVEYRVAMIGFAPGFAYLLGLDPRLHVPRRAQPRTRVPAGSVAIGGAQTGIYPGELPGGWHLIGRTPRRLFDVGRTPPSLLAAGDRVRLRAVTPTEWDVLARTPP